MSDLELLSRFDSYSVKRLKRIRNYIDSLINSKKVSDEVRINKIDPNDYVQYQSDVVTSDECTDITSEVGKLFGESVSNKSHSVWLSETTLSYSWTSGIYVSVKVAIPFSDLPAVRALKNRICADYGFDLNSCLVQYYPNGDSGIRLHDDYELDMDERQPICVVIIGEARLVEFLLQTQRHSDPAVLQIIPEHRSMYIMLPGCQENLKHRVPSDKSVTGPRFSFSFRRRACIPDVKPALNESSPVKATIMHFEAITNSPSSAPKSSQITGVQPPPLPTAIQQSDYAHEHNTPIGTQMDHSFPTECRNSKEVTLLLGTSITKWVNCQKLSDSSTEFVNISVSGARLKSPHSHWNGSTAEHMLEQFTTTKPDVAARVTRVIVSFGTNDIRFYHGRYGTPGDMQIFVEPLRRLTSKIRKSFGKGVSICYQAVLPMNPVYKYSVANIISFNRLLSDFCSQQGCAFLDWVWYFLDPLYHLDYSMFALDGVHLNGKGYRKVEEMLQYSIDADRRHHCYSNNMYF